MRHGSKAFIQHKSFRFDVALTCNLWFLKSEMDPDCLVCYRSCKCHAVPVLPNSNNYMFPIFVHINNDLVEWFSG